jgi:hypothetical protein
MNSTATTLAPLMTKGGMEAAKPPPKLYVGLPATPEDLKEHSVLFHPDTVFPPDFQAELATIGPWRLVRGEDAFSLARKIQTHGWHLFFMVPAVSATGLAQDRDRAFSKALQRVAKQIEYRKLNAFEIARVSIQRLWGIYRVRISGYPRHLKRERFLRGRGQQQHRGPYGGDFPGLLRRVQQIVRRRKAT